jgi:hypothetical protein
MSLIIFLDIEKGDLSSAAPYRAKLRRRLLDDIDGKIFNIDAGTPPPDGIINLDNLVTRNDQIDSDFRRAIRRSGNRNRYYGDDDFELPDNPISGNITIDYVSNEMDNLWRDLEQAFRGTDCINFTTSLIQYLEAVSEDRLIRLVISSDDPRIERLPFLQIPFIRSKDNGDRRKISVEFVPRSNWLITSYF